MTYQASILILRKKAIEIRNSKEKKNTPKNKEKEPVEIQNSEDERNIHEKGFMNTQISNGIVFYKKFIVISVKKEK